jgi:hypothetical protein
MLASIRAIGVPGQNIQLNQCQTPNLPLPSAWDCKVFFTLQWSPTPAHRPYGRSLAAATNLQQTAQPAQATEGAERASTSFTTACGRGLRGPPNILKTRRYMRVLGVPRAPAHHIRTTSPRITSGWRSRRSPRKTCKKSRHSGRWVTHIMPPLQAPRIVDQLGGTQSAGRAPVP